MKDTLTAAHNRGDHVYDKPARCLQCQGKEEGCRPCLMLVCIGCKTIHCPEHCRGRRPSAIGQVARRLAREKDDSKKRKLTS